MGKPRLPAFITKHLDEVDDLRLCGRPAMSFTKRELAAALISMDKKRIKEMQWQADRRSFLFGLLKKRRTE